VQAGDVRLHCAAMGPPAGPLVVLLHGFPECWVTWRFQLPALAAAGFRAVAPDMRGYGGSDKPRGVAEYAMEKLAGDVSGLIAALGRERADVVGHDWGGHVAWHLAMWNPERVRRLAILNVPHPARMRAALRTLRQLRKSWYLFFFQLPFLPERFISPESIGRSLRYMTARRGAYDKADIEAIVAAAGDRTGPINYYRAAARHRGPRWKPVSAETLVIWGEGDRFLGPELAVPDPRWVPHARVERIPGASHWVQADAPERVNQLLVEFLR
jgi:pimeloyl-ACP methyl ester carboxylesterase